ncbi:hypothetical protein LPW11_08435 [Geomonas sp. RF6]|uniref:hypothetical protein n=1 Tax=Geomonas sp. RF6 TaxID=2897342 RepID=UPI001E41B439|nr:hypothetical protein [Geomonas sp. RF6]UFS72207.1 hypothetical protein LPW11_08435 [Geomonas sp. RF6]
MNTSTSWYKDMPEGMELDDQVIERVLQSTGAVMEVWVVKNKRQYEAALFFDRRYRPGPPVPRPLEEPSGDSTHWMGARPKVGLTAEEAEKILHEVTCANALHKIQMKDTWGVAS